MATVFKTFLNDDVTSTRTLLHEAIPLTGTIVSGTYTDLNIKNYTHGMFQSVYDYPYLSSSANHIFDLTCGYSSISALSGAASEQNAKKIQIYNQMAQILVGHNESGNILKFDADGNIIAGGAKMNEVYFVNFARLLNKDEIKKGSFSMVIGDTVAYGTPFGSTQTIDDSGAQNDYRVNSPAGEYAILSSSVTGDQAGLLFYQAGVAVLTASVFSSAEMNSSAELVDAVLSGSTIEQNSDATRHRISNIQFNNTTELNSTIYFCRVNHNEYNYSSNPTYLSSSKMVVKDTTVDSPVSYITTVGLYSADNELLAVAKLSEPLKKDPTNELILRVRLDY
jgi:hypothetical protein